MTAPRTPPGATDRPPERREIGDGLLACHGLEVGYAKYAPVLRGVGLQVAHGDFAAVLGPNGAGKTTLVRALMGLIDGQPARGRIRFDGADVTTWDCGRRVRAGLACVPEGREIFPLLSVRENLILGGWASPARRTLDEDLARVFDLFPILKDRIRQQAGTLSGGEQQMLAIGRALMGRPRLLLLDEPSLGLAPKVVESIFSTVGALAREGLSFLVVEQNARMALKFARHAYVLEGGRVRLHGTAGELAENPEVREFYLGMKQSRPTHGSRRYRRRRRWV